MFFDEMNEAAAKLVAAANKRLKSNKKNAKKFKKHSESVKDVTELDDYEIARIDLMSYNKITANFKNGKSRTYVRTGSDQWKASDPGSKYLRSFDLMNNLPYIEGCTVKYE